MFAHDFVRNAYLAGTPIALACGMIGWFLVLRAQVFAGDALGHVAFVGAVAASVLGADERVGLFALTLLVGALLGGLGRRGLADDVVIGTTFAWILGLGILLIALLATSAAGGNGSALPATLFGSIYSLTGGEARAAAAIAVAVALAVALISRPLLFSSLDGELAGIRGIPVTLLGIGFLVLLAVITADSTPSIGALLLLGLLAAPAGAAHQLTARPYLGMLISGLIAVGAMWAGLALSYTVNSLPPSSAIVGVAAAAYGAAALRSRLAETPWRLRRAG